MRTAALLFTASLFIAGCGSGNGQDHAKTDTPDKAPQSEKGSPSGTKLKTEDIRVGKGNGFPMGNRPAAVGDRVFMTYTGTLKDGTVFDSTEKNGGKPFAFTIGQGAVIKGWDQGIPGMIAGGQRKLSIPADLAYGPKAQASIPANSDLNFTVELLDVVKPGEEGQVDLKDVKTGAGADVKKGSKVEFKYELTNLAGQKLDTRQSMKVTIGDGKVRKIIEDGLMGMKKGGVRELRLPPAAYIPPAKQSEDGMPAEPTVQIVRVEMKNVS